MVNDFQMRTDETTNGLFRSPGKLRNIPADYRDEEIAIIDNEWPVDNLPLFKSNMNFLMLCSKGTFSAMFNDKQVSASKGMIAICPAEVTVSDLRLSDDFEYVVLALSSNALLRYLKNNLTIWYEAVYTRRLYSLSLDAEELKFYNKFYELLRCSLDLKNYDRSKIVNGMAEMAMLCFCLKFQKILDSTEANSKGSTISLFNNFINLLQDSRIKRQSVQYYSSQLCISSKYLTDICKKYSGKTANKWIQEYTISDATYYLRNSQMSIKEISNKMGFRNSSFFCKYIRKLLGMSPLEYRRRHV
jgi:AraC-like DNA-binding protein